MDNKKGLIIKTTDHEFVVARYITNVFWADDTINITSVSGALTRISAISESAAKNILSQIAEAIRISHAEDIAIPKPVSTTPNDLISWPTCASCGNFFKPNEDDTLCEKCKKALHSEPTGWPV